MADPRFPASPSPSIFSFSHLDVPSTRGRERPDSASSVIQALYNTTVTRPDSSVTISDSMMDALRTFQSDSHSIPPTPRVTHEPELLLTIDPPPPSDMSQPLAMSSANGTGMGMRKPPQYHLLAVPIGGDQQSSPKADILALYTSAPVASDFPVTEDSRHKPRPYSLLNTQASHARPRAKTSAGTGHRPLKSPDHFDRSQVPDKSYLIEAAEILSRPPSPCVQSSPAFDLSTATGFDASVNDNAPTATRLTLFKRRANSTKFPRSITPTTTRPPSLVISVPSNSRPRSKSALGHVSIHTSRYDEVEFLSGEDDDSDSNDAHSTSDIIDTYYRLYGHGLPTPTLPNLVVPSPISFNFSIKSGSTATPTHHSAPPQSPLSRSNRPRPLSQHSQPYSLTSPLPLHSPSLLSLAPSINPTPSEIIEIEYTRSKSRLAKLQRTLGENVPASLILKSEPTPRKRRSKSLRSRRDRSATIAASPTYRSTPTIANVSVVEGKKTRGSVKRKGSDISSTQSPKTAPLPTTAAAAATTGTNAAPVAAARPRPQRPPNGRSRSMSWSFSLPLPLGRPRALSAFLQDEEDQQTGEKKSTATLTIPLFANAGRPSSPLDTGSSVMRGRTSATRGRSTTRGAADAGMKEKDSEPSVPPPIPLRNPMRYKRMHDVVGAAEPGAEPEREFTSKEKKLNVRRAIKMAQMFGDAPPSELYMNTVNPSRINLATDSETTSNDDDDDDYMDDNKTEQHEVELNLKSEDTEGSLPQTYVIQPPHPHSPHSHADDESSGSEFEDDLIDDDEIMAVAHEMDPNSPYDDYEEEDYFGTQNAIQTTTSNYPFISSLSTTIPVSTLNDQPFWHYTTIRTQSAPQVAPTTPRSAPLASKIKPSASRVPPSSAIAPNSNAQLNSFSFLTSNPSNNERDGDQRPRTNRDRSKSAHTILHHRQEQQPNYQEELDHYPNPSYSRSQLQPHLNSAPLPFQSTIVGGPPSTADEEPFQVRRKRAAKLARFFGVGVADLNSTSPHHQQPSPPPPMTQVSFASKLLGGRPNRDRDEEELARGSASTTKSASGVSISKGISNVVMRHTGANGSAPALPGPRPSTALSRPVSPFDFWHGREDDGASGPPSAFAKYHGKGVLVIDAQERPGDVLEAMERLRAIR